MRYKKLVAMVLCIMITALCLLPVYAEEVREITSAYMLEANLYYCNSNTGELVLKNVKPVAESPDAKALAESLEYTETRLFDKNLYLADGTQIEYDWLNNYADDTVRIIAVEQADGSISILYLRFI